MPVYYETSVRMHLQSDKSHRADEIKTQFRAREGYYRLMNSPDYSQRSQRAMGFSTGTANSNSSGTNQEKTCIKISLVTVNENDPSATKTHRRSRGARDMKICFNVGRELFVYNYDGVRTGPDASNPIYKRFYKGSSPTCHDFNQTTASSRSICLVVGFSHGQIHLIDLNSCEDQESCKEYNVDRLIDKTRVTCIKWLPNSSNSFLVAHASGNLYLYKDDLPCGPSPPTYQTYKRSEGVVVYTCKTKTTRNPIYKWSIGGHSLDSQAASSSSSLSSLGSLSKLLDSESCSLNEFVFSPCAKYLACVSQDGFLRVFCYDTMELVGRARSYYGGLTCVCWSPDGKYVVTGGEDDLITVWSFIQRRVVARGIGHKSWVSVVAFDTFYTGYNLKNTDADNYDDEDEEDRELDDREIDDEDVVDEDDDENTRANQRTRDCGIDSKSPSNRSSHMFNNSVCSNFSSTSPGQKASPDATSYRFGSVGQDTQLCLWDLSDDLLTQPVAKLKPSSIPGTSSLVNLASTSNTCLPTNDSESIQQEQVANKDPKNQVGKSGGASTSTGSAPTKSSTFAKTFSLVGKRDKRSFNLKSPDKSTNTRANVNTLNGDRLIDDPTKLLGSPVCPRMNEVPHIEPTISKKISFERLTSLVFCQGGFITSCQDGFVFSWARPSRKTMRLSPVQSNEELRVIDVGTSSAV